MAAFLRAADGTGWGRLVILSLLRSCREEREVDRQHVSHIKFYGKIKKGEVIPAGVEQAELVATFLAVLELCKANRIEITGNSDDAEIKLIKEHKK